MVNEPGNLFLGLTKHSEISVNKLWKSKVNMQVIDGKQAIRNVKQLYNEQALMKL